MLSSISPSSVSISSSSNSSTGMRFEQLARLIGTTDAPVLVDVRTEDDAAADPRLIPGAIRRSYDTIAPDIAAGWCEPLSGRRVIVICQRGLKLSEGVAAWLRHEGIAADVLTGGFEGWRSAELPLVPIAKLPAPNPRGRTVWVTRSRPKIDRIACPWLIRRFIDPNAVFLFVAASEVAAVGERFGATPFDIDNVFWSHRGELCTFDTMVDEFRLTLPPLLHLAQIVRAADTGRLDLSPEAAGLLAVSLGLSRIYDDDLQQLEAGIGLYDAFYRWCRDAAGETHNWPAGKVTA